MKVVIVEDEKLAAEKLAHLLKKTDMEIEVVQHIEGAQYLQYHPDGRARRDLGSLGKRG